MRVINQSIEVMAHLDSKSILSNLGDCMAKQRCSDCWSEYPLTAEHWHRNRARFNGFNNICKECTNERYKDKYVSTKKLNEYALYKGDELLGSGTVEELANRFGVKEATIRYYKTATYKKRSGESNTRRTLIKLEA